MDIVAISKSLLPENYGGNMTNRVFILGLFSLAAIITIFSRIIWTFFKLYVLAQMWPKLDLKELGDWAVITGATDGIGYQYSLALAKRGLNILLLSRSNEKLEKVSKEITTLYGVEVRHLAVDFSEMGVYQEIRKSLKDMHVAILINNVGVSQPTPSRFLDMKNIDETLPKMLLTNCLSMAMMSAIVLDKMVAERRGVILNISSLSAENGYLPSSYYVATKCFMNSLSRSLYESYKQAGIHVQTLAAGMVRTQTFLNYAKGANMSHSLLSVDPRVYVETSLNTVGWSHYCHGHAKHYLTSLLARIFAS